MTDTTRRGRMITVEGIDGAGKSTHLPWLKELLERSAGLGHARTGRNALRSGCAHCRCAADGAAD
jgi:ABC-type transport system involved in cytochrome c biogenesis ATPase subunit